MRFIGILTIGIVGVLIGWYMRGVFIPADVAVSSPKLPKLQQPHELGSYRAKSSVPQSADNVSFADELRPLLKNENYDEVMVRYNQRLNTLSKQEAEQIRRLILQHARGLFQSREYSEALGLLEEYLGTEFRDVDALLIKADVLAQQKAYNQQIKILYDAKSYAYQQEVIGAIENKIRDSVDRYKNWLLENKRYTELLSLFQELVYLEPNYSPYFIELAKAQRTNNQEQDAQQSLELVRYDPLVGEQARRLLAESGDDAVTEHRDIAQVDINRGIPLQRRGSHFVVEATLNGFTPLRLIIDTGASLTVIKSDRLQAALGNNLSQFPVHKFNTANGVVKAPVLSVESLAIGEFEVANLQVGGLDLVNTAGVDGLLGMNFLKHYRFFIDQQNNLLRLSINNEN